MSKKWFNILGTAIIFLGAITLWFPIFSFGADLLPKGRGMIDMGPPPEDPSVIENWVLTNQSTSKITVQDFSRYPAEVGEQQWQPLDDGKAYFRDVFVGLNTYIYSAENGEWWTCKDFPPSGIGDYWPKLYFLSDYNGMEDCFIADGQWYRCGSRNMSVIWYRDMQCDPTGTWAFTIYENSWTDAVSSKSFAFLPQIKDGEVPLYSQVDNLDHYDHICRPEASSDDVAICSASLYPNQVEYTIGEKGCALVSAVMLLRYHAITTGKDGQPATPTNLNNWLKGEEDGYIPIGNVNWGKLYKYSNNNIKFISPILYREDDPNIDATLKNAVCDKGPQIIHTKNSGHFVVASGQDMAGTTWLISDPDGGNYTTLTDVAEYNNTYQSIRKFGGPEYYYPYLQYMEIRLYPYDSPGELVLKDPEGRRAGYDPIAGVKYREIPNSSYGLEGLDDHGTGAPGPKSIVISVGRPMAGGYDLQVIGTEGGNYGLWIYVVDQSDNSKSKRFDRIPISPGVVHTYAINYSDTVATNTEFMGGFDGKGQRPRDVNKFLSFSNPTQARTELPAGTNTFDLVIFYDKTTIPGSFKAELNGTNITSLFSPALGKTEVVKLNLASGSNTLIVSIEGTVIRGRVTKDTDRLVFIVP